MPLKAMTMQELERLFCFSLGQTRSPRIYIVSFGKTNATFFLGSHAPVGFTYAIPKGAPYLAFSKGKGPPECLSKPPGKRTRRLRSPWMSLGLTSWSRLLVAVLVLIAEKKAGPGLQYSTAVAIPTSEERC